MDASRDQNNRITIDELLRTLGEINRRIVLMRMQGYTQAEIGEAVGLSQSAVNRRWAKLQGILRERLDLTGSTIRPD